MLCQYSNRKAGIWVDTGPKKEALPETTAIS
jgi:hypothetical protein